MNARNLIFQKLKEANGANRILWHLVNHYSIEPIRLGARIYDLRAQGWDIVKKDKIAKNRYGIEVRFAEYRLRSKVRDDGSTFCSECLKATLGTDHCGDHK